MVTLTDIAKKTGHSLSTVSKALRGSDDINKDTASKISAIAAEMGYTLKKQNTYRKQCIGILCPEVVSGYYARIVSTLSGFFGEQNIDTFLSVSEFNTERERDLLGHMLDMKMAAIICITEQAVLSPLIRESIALHNIPILQIAMNLQSMGHDNICVDEHMGLTLIVNHLVQLGHKRIAFLGEQYSERRMQYFQEAVRNHGLSDTYTFVTQSLRHWQAGYELAGLLLGDWKKKGISAVVAEYDDIAVGAMRRFGEAGLRVPEDYSIAGFDNAKYCHYLPVSLTTVDSHVEEMCRIAFETLLKKIKDPRYKLIQNISIVPDLVHRESTAVPLPSKK